MVYLIDTNIIIRFLVGDHAEHLAQSSAIFSKVEACEIEVHILESVMMEAFFVLTKFYKLPKEEVINDLKRILSLDGIVNDDKFILFETLSIVENKNIDFVDALLCAKQRLQGFEIVSFDQDIKKCDKYS
ncbi:MAG: PIN domain-containing protein [Sulfuricurvum sp.]